MAQDWADKTAKQLVSQGLMQDGICLVLGAADTGKTTLVEALAKRAASNRPVAVVDADIGQSHIGPPTTVGWALVDNPEINFSQLTPNSISFVGDVSPVGHLLQLTGAIAQCVRQAAEAAALIIIDTPGLVYGGAANALWWTVQRVLQPKSILAVQRSDELAPILAGLRTFKIELIESPAQIPTKSPEKRRIYRQKQFEEYFRDSCLDDIRLSDIAVQSGRNLNRNSCMHRLVALRGEKGTDMAIGIIERWHADKDLVVVRAPQIDVGQIRCLVIGDHSVELPQG